jgi:5-methylcytosine-specific restriction endonuclease McrA
MPPIVRNPELRPWRTWYQLESWRRRRRLQLKQHPLCAECLSRGVVERATVADHTKPHRGDWNAFRLGELQSLCDACHNSSKRRFDLDGYDSQLLDAQGWPVDPRHPANR